MTRLAFRASVDAPRPASAWVLVIVASATLWITEQLAPWTVALQVAAIVGSLWLRASPHPWQRSPIALNVGMLGIVTIVISVALRGGPSTIALAHFAALTQGLQLLDARPRRTEYLLVALALFQVVLAANLTDSVWFTPLLLAFLFATVWTLMVHTLRSEAIEASDPTTVTGALTPALMKMTLVSGLLSVLLASVLFVALPRLRSSVVMGSGAGPSFATAGFSDRVQLGELGRIRQDSTVVMRVETLQGAPPAFDGAYWRGLAFDTFDGVSWSITPAERSLVPGSPEGGVTLGAGPADADLVQRIVREPVEAGVVFAVGEPRAIQGMVRSLERDSSGGLYAVGQHDERIRYSVTSRRIEWRDAGLRRDLALPPGRNGSRYLGLPPLPPEISDLAQRIAGDADSDADRIRAIERYLMREGRYSDRPPELPEDGGTPIAAFLFGGLAGHCEYFATAMVVLARSLGIPARLVNGFAGGRLNRIGDFVEITRSDAHAWVEVHYDRAGWVRYDPTPPDLRARAAVAPSLAARLGELGSALELWWFQRVVGFDRSDQISAVKRAWLRWQASRPGRPGGSARAANRDWLPETLAWREGLIVGLLAAALLALWRHQRADAGTTPVPRIYREALRLLARRGLVRDAAVTARDFARAVRPELPLAAGAAFAAITEAYLRERFGGRAESLASRGRLLDLEDSLERG